MTICGNCGCQLPNHWTWCPMLKLEPSTEGTQAAQPMKCMCAANCHFDCDDINCGCGYHDINKQVASLTQRLQEMEARESELNAEIERVSRNFDALEFKNSALERSHKALLDSIYETVCYACHNHSVNNGVSDTEPAKRDAAGIWRHKRVVCYAGRLRDIAAAEKL